MAFGKLVLAAIGSAASGSFLGGILVSFFYAAISTNGWRPEQAAPVFFAGMFLGLVGFVIALLPVILLGLPMLWVAREQLNLPVPVTAAVLGCVGGLLGRIIWRGGPAHFGNPDFVGPIAIGLLVGLLLTLFGSRSLAAP